MFDVGMDFDMILYVSLFLIDPIKGRNVSLPYD